MPMHDVIFKNTRILFFGTIAATTTFVIFYLMTVFCLSWGTSVLHFPRSTFLMAQMIGVLFFAIGIPIAGMLADKYGRGNILILTTALIFMFGLVFASLFNTTNLPSMIVFLSIGLLLMGFTYGPLGAALAEVFPTSVRYTGASLTFTLAGILGASLAPYLATAMATQYGLEYVGYYLSICALLSLISFICIRPLMQD